MALRSVPETSATGLTDTEQADIDLLHGLVAIESLSHGEVAAVAWLREQMAARGMTVLDDAAGNAVATVGSGDRHIVLLGHIDTVPGRIPVRIEQDVLWGRGAVDAKGPLATFVAAASAASADLRCRVTVVGAVGEEVIGSPGANELRAELDRWNAGAKNSFHSIGHSLRAFNTSGDGLTDEAVLSIGLRLPPDLDVSLLLERIRHLAAPGQVAIDGIQEGYRTGKQSKLVPPFLRSIREAGGSPRFTLKLGTSDMNVVGPVWKCPIVAYGPGDSSLDHTPDERIDLREYLRAVRVLRNVLLSVW